MATATYEVKVDWDNNPVNAFRIDVSEVGGTDVLGGGITDADFSGEFDDISGYVTSDIEVDRGRPDDLSATDAGRATIVLTDPEGRFNPKNSSSPLVDKLVPLKQVRIRAIQAGVGTFTLFTGFIDDLEHDPHPDVKTTTMTCIDALDMMNEVHPTVSSLGTTTTGTAIRQCLSDGGISNEAESNIDIDDGDTIPDFSAAGDSAVTSLVSDLLVAERGLFYVTAAGTIKYDQRSARSNRTTSGTLTNQFENFVTGSSKDLIKNRARVTRVGGTLQEVVEYQSARRYGLRDHQEIETPYLTDDNAALSLANYLVGVQSSPRQRIFNAPLNNRSADTLTQILSRDLGDKIVVTEARAGVNIEEYFIERITHNITEGGKVHRCTWVLAQDPGTGSPFQIGSSLFDSGDVLTY